MAPPLPPLAVVTWSCSHARATCPGRRSTPAPPCSRRRRLARPGRPPPRLNSVAWPPETALPTPFSSLFSLLSPSMKTTIDGHQWCSDGRPFPLSSMPLSLPLLFLYKLEMDLSLPSLPDDELPLSLTRSSLPCSPPTVPLELRPRSPTTTSIPCPPRPPNPSTSIPAHEQKLQGRRRQFCDLVPGL
jgi:hypothetical protein